MLVNYLFLVCLFCMYFLFSSRTKKRPVSCVLCPFDESQNRNYARAKSVTALYIVLFSLDTKLGQEYLQDRYHSRFFVQVGHETTYASSGNNL